MKKVLAFCLLCAFVAAQTVVLAKEARQVVKIEMLGTKGQKKTVKRAKTKKKRAKTTKKSAKMKKRGKKTAKKTEKKEPEKKY